ncbi:NAD(P)H-binding protein [Streptomyces sp. AC602_WCS936]|uniref:NAD(P)H-binding protein n=1 Tax=Streptomyces sp. AC602_WCS936 TaxID=2823685 RepID=UPI001C25B99E|nr:NAD(P)H-binding protein [Streptomyces sp. AC602_WCS936]
MILVTGATGTVGGEVAKRLATGHGLRVMTREPRRCAVAGPRAEVVRGDYRDTASLERALCGVRAAFLVTNHFTEPHDERFLEAARRAGVEHVVKLSAAVVDDDVDDAVTRRQRRNEAAVRASGIAWTLLRPRAFMSNTLSWCSDIRSHGVVSALYGDAPNAPVDPRDVAAVAVRALTEPGHRGRCYTLAGPETLTARQQTRILSAVLGRPLMFREMSRFEAGRVLRARHSRPLADALLQRADLQLAGGKSLLSDSVSALTGSAPRSYRVWASAHAHCFAEEGSPALRV